MTGNIITATSACFTTLVERVVQVWPSGPEHHGLRLWVSIKVPFQIKSVGRGLGWTLILTPPWCMGPRIEERGCSNSPRTDLGIQAKTQSCENLDIQSEHEPHRVW